MFGKFSLMELTSAGKAVTLLKRYDVASFEREESHASKNPTSIPTSI